MENLPFLGFYVVDLICVTFSVNETGISKIMEVISFVGVLTKAIVKFH